MKLILEAFADRPLKRLNLLTLTLDQFSQMVSRDEEPL
jgi:hypothetical protein